MIVTDVFDFNMLESPEFKKIITLWNREGFVMDVDDGMLLFEFFAPEVDSSKDYIVAIDVFNYEYAVFRPTDNWARMISQTEHKLIVKTINVLKKLRKDKEVENDN